VQGQLIVVIFRGGVPAAAGRDPAKEGSGETEASENIRFKTNHDHKEN
jgi:hypothetical protein